MSGEQLVALLSCVVWAEKREGGTKLPEALKGPFAALQETARRVAKVSVFIPKDD